MYDEANDLTNWTTQGGWDITTEQFATGPTSFTDSPNRNYSPNVTSVLNYKNQFNYINTIYTFLEFDGLWDIEYQYDYGMVQLSTNNGCTWIPPAGQYTEPGGNNQSKGSPLYDGTQPNWVHEIINISKYVNHPFNLRFFFTNQIGWGIMTAGILIT